MMMTEKQYNQIVTTFNIPEGYERFKILCHIEEDWNIDDVLRVAEKYSFFGKECDITLNDVKDIILYEEDDEFRSYLAKARECDILESSELQLIGKIRKEGAAQVYTNIDNEYRQYEQDLEEEERW